MDKLANYSVEEFAHELAVQAKGLIQEGSAIPHDSNRKAILLGGQSGAGKTMLHYVFYEKFNDDVIIINGDNFRKLHPRYVLLETKYGDAWVEQTAAWSGAMTESLIDRLSKLGYNLIIEGTLRTSEVPMKTAKLLRERGYSVELALMAVKPEISLLSCQLRYEEMRIAGTTPRATDPAHHAKIVNEIADNLGTLEASGLFDDIHLYTRAQERLQPAEGASAADTLRECLFGDWTDEEREHRDVLQRRLEALQAQ
jgi:UDP-N-acetylglucosamine kinase